MEGVVRMVGARTIASKEQSKASNLVYSAVVLWLDVPGFLVAGIAMGTPNSGNETWTGIPTLQDEACNPSACSTLLRKGGRKGWPIYQRWNPFLGTLRLFGLTFQLFAF